MFVVYCDGKPFYAPHIIDRDLKLTSAKITYEINKAGSFEYTIPPINKNYNIFKKLKSIITVEEDGKEIWRGRVLDSRRDFYNNKKMTCEGELAFLNDGLARPYDHSDGVTVQDMFAYYNRYYTDNGTPERLIYFGNITAVSPSKKVYIKSDTWIVILDDLLDNLVNKLGGLLTFRETDGKRYLDWINPADNISDQIIEFGRNLINFEEYIDASKIYTYEIPLGKVPEGEETRINIMSVNDGFPHVQSEAGMSLYGRIEKLTVFDDIDDPNLLKTIAQEDVNNAINEAVTIEIRAVDLKDLGANPNHIKIGQYARVISKPHNVDSYFLCSKIELDLLNPGNSVYTFGTSESSLIDSQIATNKISMRAYNIATGENQYIIDSGV